MKVIESTGFKRLSYMDFNTQPGDAPGPAMDGGGTEFGGNPQSNEDMFSQEPEFKKKRKLLKIKKRKRDAWYRKRQVPEPLKGML